MIRELPPMQPDEWQAFEAFARRLLAVSHDEIQALRKADADSRGVF